MAKALRERVGKQYKGTQRTRKAVHGECSVELAKWTLPIISLGVEPCAVKVACTVLNGEGGETGTGTALCPYPTPTPYSLRFATASRHGSCPALGVRGAGKKPLYRTVEVRRCGIFLRGIPARPRTIYATIASVLSVLLRFSVILRRSPSLIPRTATKKIAGSRLA